MNRPPNGMAVRNYQARNFMRDDMRVGDHVLFYHSNAKPPGSDRSPRASSEKPILMTLPGTLLPATTTPKSDPANPTWLMVEIQAQRRLPRFISLNELKANPALADMQVIRRGQRLSVQPVTPQQWAEVLAMAERPAD